MIDMKIEKSAFEEFAADETELGIDLDKIKEVLRLSRSGDVISLEQDEEKNRLVINVGNVTRRMNLVDTTGMSDPKVPNLNLPAKVAVASEELQKGIKAAESISDHIALTAQPEGFEMVSEGDTDSVSLKLSKDQLVSLECKESVRSLFPLDYFSNMIRAIPMGTVITMSLGNDYPVKLEFSIADGRGTVNYLLAPRIESD
jgi:proliferating cell nuclear antigen